MYALFLSGYPHLPLPVSSLVAIVYVMNKAWFNACICVLLSCRLVSLGLDVNKRHELGWTPLQVAVVNRNIRLVSDHPVG